MTSLAKIRLETEAAHIASVATERATTSTAISTVVAAERVITNTNQAAAIAASAANRLAAVATSGRPVTGIVAGSTVFDTTLGKPIWYNGTVWKDAAGTTV